MDLSNKSTSLVCQIDYAKAPRKIEWHFIFGMLKAPRLGQCFTQTIEMLFPDASAILTINQTQLQSFKLSHSIHEGFPLAPSLYILALEGFGYILAHRVDQGHFLPHNNAQLINR